MKFSINEKLLEVLKGRVKNPTDLMPSFVGEVVPLNYAGRDLVQEICESISFKWETKNIVDPGFFIFGNVGMHTDDIYPKGVKSLVVVVKGCGSLQYFKNKEELKKCNISNVFLSPGKGVIFDQNLPHSFSLGYEEPACISFISGI